MKLQATPTNESVGHPAHRSFPRCFYWPKGPATPTYAAHAKRAANNRNLFQLLLIEDRALARSPTKETGDKRQRDLSLYRILRRHQIVPMLGIITLLAIEK
jgi:hypothetical protein